MVEAMKSSIDPDKAATTPVVAVIVKGVCVSSRYQKQDEIERMTRAISAMPEPLSRAIDEFWCDSKATHTYNAVMRPGFDRPEVTQAIAVWVSQWMIANHGGHNGVSAGTHGWTDPDWPLDGA